MIDEQKKQLVEIEKKHAQEILNLSKKIANQEQVINELLTPINHSHNNHNHNQNYNSHNNNNESNMENDNNVTINLVSSSDDSFNKRNFKIDLEGERKYVRRENSWE
eukprot:Pgem_evm1s15831